MKPMRLNKVGSYFKTKTQMRNIFSLLPKDSKKLYAVISLGFAVVLFLLFALTTKNLLISLFFSIGIFLFTFITSIFDEILGKKRHYKILESNGFKELINRGFELVEKNQYIGLTGNFDSYIFDIYYDWSTFVRSKVYKAVIFNVYFEPPRLSNGQTDYDKMKQLAEKHEVSKWSFKNYNFWWRDGNIIMRNGVGIMNPSHKKLLERMTLVLNILKSEGLKPIDRKTLEEWRRQDPMNNIPEIVLYYEEK